MERREGEFLFTDDKTRVDPDSVVALLRQTHWAKNRNRDTIIQTIKTSLCFSVYCKEQQIGFARVISDYAVYSLILDVIIEEKYRGQGLGTKLIRFINNHPALTETHKALWTRYAAGFYTPLGFEEEKEMVFMIKRVL